MEWISIGDRLPEKGQVVMEWINIKDKLPEEGQVVIAWDTCKDCNQNVEQAYLENGKWFRLQEEEFSPTILKDITHWFIPTKPQ